MQTVGWAALFLVSAGVVVRSGLSLSKAGDHLAEATGLGRLWVGTILLAIATSLPELVTNLAAVRFDAPALAGGNVLGANMLNIVTLAALVSLFPKAVVRPMGRDQQILVGTALFLTAVVVAAIVFGAEWNVGPVGLGTFLIIWGYIIGIGFVLRALDNQGKAEPQEEGKPAAQVPLGRVWGWFALAAGGVLIAAPVLVVSADRLADILGISGSFMGVLAVALVTTMPEMSVTWGALRLGSETMALGNVYGSCAFNILILAFADLLYPKPIFLALDRSHIAAGVGACFLMGLGPAFLSLRARGKLALSRALALVMALGWAGLIYLVLTFAQHPPA
jgi:cation:H+ antiporter